MALFRRVVALLHRSRDENKVKPESDLYLYGANASKKILFVTVLGVATDNLEEIVDTVSGKFRAYDRIVYITDSPDFIIFRRKQATFEYIPSLAAQAIHARAMDWQSYLKARWELLLKKWQPEQVISYGLNFDRFIFSASRSGPSNGV